MKHFIYILVLIFFAGKTTAETQNRFTVAIHPAHLMLALAFIDVDEGIYFRQYAVDLEYLLSPNWAVRVSPRHLNGGYLKQEQSLDLKGYGMDLGGRYYFSDQFQRSNSWYLHGKAGVGWVNVTAEGLVKDSDTGFGTDLEIFAGYQFNTGPWAWFADFGLGVHRQFIDIQNIDDQDFEQLVKGFDELLIAPNFHLGVGYRF